MSTLDDINNLSDTAFAARFGDVAEHSPWVAQRCSGQRPFRDVAHMIRSFVAVIMHASSAEQLALIRAHPDLAGRAAPANKLTGESKSEQAGAGLDQLTETESARFFELNERYKRQFGFPFIAAVKGGNKRRILAAFESRIGNTPAQELKTALEQIGHIVKFRLDERVNQ